MNETRIRELNRILEDILLRACHYGPEEVLLGQGSFLDSVTVLAFVSKVEEQYRIDILEEDLNLDCLKTMGALAEFLEAHPAK
jgi:acyl carrier protein